MRRPLHLALLFVLVAGLGCARPLAYHRRQGPEVTADAVLWTWVSIARAPHAWFNFHLRLDPPPPCAAVEWEWGDGRSVRDSDCAPDEIGAAVYEMSHVYRYPGPYTVTASVISRGQLVARASTDVMVLPGLGQ